jgi:hypothetical protein
MAADDTVVQCTEFLKYRARSKGIRAFGAWSVNWTDKKDPALPPICFFYNHAVNRDRRSRMSSELRSFR